MFEANEEHETRNAGFQEQLAAASRAGAREALESMIHRSQMTLTPSEWNKGYAAAWKDAANYALVLQGGRYAEPKEGE